MKIEKEIEQFRLELDTLISQASTIAKVAFGKDEPSTLPVAVATNMLYLLSLFSGVTVKDTENLNATYSFCFKLL